MDINNYQEVYPHFLGTKVKLDPIAHNTNLLQWPELEGGICLVCSFPDKEKTTYIHCQNEKEFKQIISGHRRGFPMSLRWYLIPAGELTFLDKRSEPGPSTPQNG